MQNVCQSARTSLRRQGSSALANRIPKLTKRAVETLRANGADTVHWDGELTGFGIRGHKSGRKNHVLQTRVRGRLRWFAIGQHGRVTLDEARAAALEILAQTGQGIGPREAEAKRRAEPVMADLGRRFLEEYVRIHCKPSTQGECRRSVELFIDPALGGMRISEVERKDVAGLHFGLRAKPCQANRTLGALSRTFPLAEAWGWRPDGSRCHGTGRRLPSRVIRCRVLTGRQHVVAGGRETATPAE